MRLYWGSWAILLGLALAAPRPDNSKESAESKEKKESKESKESNEDDPLIVSKEFYPDAFIVYRAEHEIVNILVPLNAINFDDDSEDNDTKDDDEPYIFFVEADFDSNGNKIDKGLYKLHGGKAQKLLDNGRDISASNDHNNEVFIAASDGIYVYKNNYTVPVKYGKFDQAVAAIAKENGTDVIYALTDARELYKITEDGERITKVEEVAGAKEIVLDFENNLFYYGDDLQPYVLKDGAKRIVGLPSKPKSVKLIKPPFLLDNGVPFMSDDVAYLIYPNGTSQEAGFEFKSDAKPSAYGVEATLIQYFGYEKKIYEYNILAILLSEAIQEDELKSYLQTNSNAIRSMASRSRSNLTSTSL